MNNYRLEGDVYIMKDYDKLPPFSSFLPGLAGKKGIPLWVFYTNRGQGVNSFGIHNKGNAIMEFNPANTAYENTEIKGFRTFLKVNGKFFEPFRGLNPSAERNFYIHKNSFVIEEVNQEYGLKITVKYFVLPHNSIGALVRRVTLENLDREAKQLEMLDGLPKIIPYGIKNGEYKEMSNLLKSWTEVNNTGSNIPYYTLRSSSGDSAEVSDIEGGYFYLGIQEGKVQPVVYDAEAIFGYDTSLVNPVCFLQRSIQEITAAKQCHYNKIPCGFTPLSTLLKAHEKYEFTSLTGFAGSIEQLNRKASEFCAPQFIEKNDLLAEELADQLTADIRTHSGEPLFDKYMEQNYLDNFLRGGYPFVFGDDNRKSVVHLFSRKHGDPERDYNFFSIAGEYYSQGNGNFRDVSQNRRNDVFFCKEIGDFNVKTFYELIQIDGYNPLEVRPSTFTVRPEYREAAEQLIKDYIPAVENAADNRNKLQDLIHKGSFTPGQIANRIAQDQMRLLGEEDEFLEKLLRLTDQNIEAGFGEGYWSDHWNYNMDLVDSYLSIFPEKRKELLFEDASYRFYDSPARVLPRSEKYVINKKGEARQYGALVHDEEKLDQAGFEKKGTNWLKTADGGYARTTLAGKMLTLILNKFSSLDPYGMGVEMEGGKPGWNDAMNGLPGLFGSGMAETLELKRMITFLADTLQCTNIMTEDIRIELPAQLHSFLMALAHTLEQARTDSWSDFQYWDAATTLREQFREQVRFGLAGTCSVVSASKLAELLAAFLYKLEEGVKKACTYGEGIVPTYFTYEAVEFSPVYDPDGNKVLSGYGLPKASVNAFRVKPLPAFLEGPAKLLASLKGTPQAEELYRKVRESELYDAKLGMYKTSVPIEHISMENGRIRAFTPGWLERESIFLHMEYKYLLSVLRAGLYEQFFGDIRTGMVAFRNPQEYGRSTLENSSFLASAANPNETIHGRGYVARLSGSTTEAVTMWIEMFVGERVFTYENGMLALNFNPKLPGWMFDENGEASFTLLSSCQAVYHNPARQATYGDSAVQPKRIVVSDTGEEFSGNRITGAAAERIRRKEIKKIDLYLD